MDQVPFMGSDLSGPCMQQPADFALLSDLESPLRLAPPLMLASLPTSLKAEMIAELCYKHRGHPADCHHITRIGSPCWSPPWCSCVEVSHTLGFEPSNSIIAFSLTPWGIVLAFVFCKVQLCNWFWKRYSYPTDSLMLPVVKTRTQCWPKSWPVSA